MSIKYRMAAWCAAAGRQHNEDNFLVKDNLSLHEWGVIKTDNIGLLGDKGALLVVCDGMGGTNAGEIASELAVKTIQEQFDSENLNSKVTANSETIMNFIERAIIAADNRIKEDGRQDASHKGMGSTIVLAWIIGKKIYVGWCGDSRAYRYNPAFGLEQLSRDHSYIQELVDSGKLAPELAFEHPDSNIITRSLGDNSKKLRPEVKCFDMYNDDIIMLCSDGLSGVLRDDEMESIMANNTDSMEKCRETLWTESENVGWTDNVTIVLCQVMKGADTAPKNRKIERAGNIPKKQNKKTIIAFIAALLAVFIVFEIGYYLGKGYFFTPKLFVTSCKAEAQEMISDFENSNFKKDVVIEPFASQILASLATLEDEVEKMRTGADNLCDLVKSYKEYKQELEALYDQWIDELIKMSENISALDEIRLLLECGTRISLEDETRIKNLHDRGTNDRNPTSGPRQPVQPQSQTAPEPATVPDPAPDPAPQINEIVDPPTTQPTTPTTPTAPPEGGQDNRGLTEIGKDDDE